MRTLLLTLLLTLPCMAQDNNFRVYGDVSGISNSGTENPILSAGVGLDRKLSDALTLDADAVVRRTRKNPGGGYSFGAQASLRVGKEFFGIGGVSVAKQITESYTKTATNIFGGVGYRRDNVTLTAVYLLPDLTSPNKSQRVAVRAQIFAPHHVYIAPHVLVSSFRCNQTARGLTDRCVSSEVGVALGFYLRR